MHQTILVAQQNRLAEDETVYNFKVKKALKARFVKAAKQGESDGSKELRRFMEWYAGYHEATGKTVELALLLPSPTS